MINYINYKAIIKLNFYLFLNLISKANVNVRDSGSFTPLMKAICLGRKGIVEILLKNGADLTLKDELGRNSLDLAELYEQWEIYDYLKEKIN